MGLREDKIEWNLVNKNSVSILQNFDLNNLYFKQ